MFFSVRYSSTLLKVFLIGSIIFFLGSCDKSITVKPSAVVVPAAASATSEETRVDPVSHGAETPKPSPAVNTPITKKPSTKTIASVSPVEAPIDPPPPETPAPESPPRIETLSTESIAPPKTPEPIYADVALRETFESNLIAGKAIEGDEKYGAVDEWAKAVDTAGDLDGAIARLSAAAEVLNAPPQVNLALAALYGRKGLIQKQYAALVSAEKAAKARPDVVFSLSAVYGRKDILKATYSADELLVGTLRISSDPPGAQILVDGKDNGSTPATIDKLKEGTHRVMLVSADYFPWEAPFDVITGRETALTGKLELKPGSVEVAIGPIGTLRLDNGPWRDAPYTFTDVAPGEHQISINPILVNNRFYDLSGDHRITVLPGKKTLYNQQFPIGKSKLQILDAPAGSTLYIDDRQVDATAFTGELEIESGSYTLRVVVPSGQEWYQKNVVVFPNETQKISFSQMTGILARRTIKLDGKPDSWGNLLPYAESSDSSFMGDSGFGIKRVYMCRDNKNLYWRVDFQSKNPLSTPPPGTQERIQGSIMGKLKDGGHIELTIAKNKVQNQMETWFGFGATDSTFNTVGDGSSLSYQVSKTMIVGRLVYSTMSKHLNVPTAIRFILANTNNGRWVHQASSENFTIDFSK